MVRRLAFGAGWLGLIIYAGVVAPPDQPDTWELIRDLSTGNWDSINPLVVALFNIMGIWPMIYSCVLFFDGRGQRVWAWPFAIASFAVGAFALLPYLTLRTPHVPFVGEKNFWLKILDSRWTGGAIALGTLGLLIYGLSGGQWADFVQQWQTSRFIHVMSLDFCLLCLLFPTLLGDDMMRRGWSHPAIFWTVAIVPLLGPIVYLMVRPPIRPAAAQAAQSTASQPDSVGSIS